MTSKMNFITADAVCSAYPRLTARRETIRGFDYPSQTDYLDMIRRGIPRVDTASWDVPCGYHCRSVYRRTEGLRGFGQFRWGGAFGDGLMQGIDPAVRSDGPYNLQWHLGVYFLARMPMG